MSVILNYACTFQRRKKYEYDTDKLLYILRHFSQHLFWFHNTSREATNSSFKQVQRERLVINPF